MIQANELRLGNWVTITGVPIQLTQKKIAFILEEDNSTTRCSPIPLTPEILERCGFEKGCLVKELNNEWMIYYNNGMWLQVEKAEHPYICERKDLFHIKYLHQLQNLYYALTGSELEIR